MVLLVASLGRVGGEEVCHARIFSATKARRASVLEVILDAWVGELRTTLGWLVGFEDVDWHAWRALAESK